MKFTLNLLKEVINLNPECTLQDIANTLTIAGIEVEEVIDYAALYKSFSIGFIKETQTHANSNKLQVCTVLVNPTGKKEEKLQIVCGASNAKAGIYVVFAAVGTYIKSLDITLSKASIRGVDSYGMLLSEKEIGLSNEHGKIMEFTDGKVGQTLADKLNLNDVIFNVAITPNRGDCLGVIGIARELQAYGLGTIKDNLYNSAINNIKELSIEIDIKDNLSNSFGLYLLENVDNINNNNLELLKIKQYLTKCGFKSISPVVDVINYCSLLFNQPMHAYDYNSLNNPNKVVVEDIGKLLNKNLIEVTDLKNKIYKFSADSTDNNHINVEITAPITLPNQTITQQVINKNIDNAIPVVNFYNNNNCVHGAFAGVMGLLNASSNNNSSVILLEIAHFNAISVALSKRKLDINSDSSYRFEREIDIDNLNNVAKYVINLLNIICGAKLVSYKAKTITKPQNILQVALSEINDLTENQFKIEEISQLLGKLGYTTQANTSVMQISPPGYRNDCLDSGVIIADIIRLYGFNNLKEGNIKVMPSEIGKTTYRLYDRIISTKQTLATLGLLETYSMSFISKVLHEEFALHNSNYYVVNPISEDLKYMRTSLISSLINIAKNNLLKFNNNFKLFEVSSVYVEDKEIYMASGLLVGNKFNKSWNTEETAFNAWHSKLIVNEILFNYGFNYSNLNVESNNLPKYYHPTKAGKYSLGTNNTIAYFGQLHPQVLNNLDIKTNIIAFEIFIENIPFNENKFNKSPIVISEHTPIVRDFSIVFNDSVKIQEIIKVVKAVDKKLISSVDIVDIYKGDKIAALSKSISFRVTIVSLEKTLVDAEIQEISNNIINSLQQKLQGVIRS